MATTQISNRRVVALGVSLIQRITGHQGEGRDVTNPRELYAILSLADAKRVQTSLAAPLSIDASPSPSSEDNMNTRVADYSPRRRRRRNVSPIRPDHHNSMEMLESYRRNIPSLTLMKHSSSLDDLSKQCTNRDNKRELIRSQGRSLFFPEITNDKNKVTFQVCMSEQPNKQTKKSKANVHVKREPSVPRSRQNNKELFTESCQGVNGYLLQKSILARLRLRDQKVDKSRPAFPKLESNKIDLRAYDKYPNQYWELRSESVHQPQDLEVDMIDRELYRMKQKSTLKLKVMDQDKYDRRQRDLYNFQQDEAVVSSPTKRPRQKPRAYSETASEINDDGTFGNLIIGPVSENYEPISANVNHGVATSNYRKVKQGTPYFLTDENVKDTPTEVRLEPQILKGEIGTKVVTISIQHDTPKKRNPKHIEQSLVKQQETHQCNYVKESDTTCNCAADQNIPHTRGDQSACKDPTNICKSKRQNEHKQKALLQGFKKIEVFGEHKQNLQSYSNEPVLKVADEPKKYIPRCHPPIYKLDMRNYPPQGNAIAIVDNREDGEAKTRCRSTSVKVVDGTIILKRLSDPDSLKNAVENTNNDIEDTVDTV